jgi:uncharacterized protein (DUF2249 family)
MEITPKTKVGELLDEYPQLEPVLLKLSPAFASLKNPVLRRTVAKVAALQQAAAIGNLKVEELVNFLRAEVGQQPLFGSEADSGYLTGEQPGWYNKTDIVNRFDARETINTGGSPMSRILDEVKQLKPGEQYELITPFVPAPIIDLLKSKGLLVWTDHYQDGVRTIVMKKN